MFDGILNWLGGGNGVAINYRFSQTARTERNRQNHRYPEAPFPFAYPAMTDRLTGKVGGRGVECAGKVAGRGVESRQQPNTCPKVFEANSSNEYWVKTGSLLHSDPLGRDLQHDPANVRFYLLSSLEHTVGGSPQTPGTCQQIRNTTDPKSGVARALRGARAGCEAGRDAAEERDPRSRHAVYSSAGRQRRRRHPASGPGLSRASRASPTPVSSRCGTSSTSGPQFDDGIIDREPAGTSRGRTIRRTSRTRGCRRQRGSRASGCLRSRRRSRPPRAGRSGAPPSAAGRAGARAARARASGSRSRRHVPNALRRVIRASRSRSATRSHADYVDAVAKAARKLEARRFLLPFDVQRYIDQAEASDVLR